MILKFRPRALGPGLLVLATACGHGGKAQVPTPATRAPTGSAAVACLSSGDGYLHATVAGAVESKIDWPNSGTHCQGESRDTPPGVRISFQRDGAEPDLLIIFGLTGVKAGVPARAVGANLTVIVQGTEHIYGTLGDSRCTVDTLSQRELGMPGVYRVEARGFCTQPAHAVRGTGDVLVSTFDFAGPVSFLPDDPKPDPRLAHEGH